MANFLRASIAGPIVLTFALSLTACPEKRANEGGLRPEETLRVNLITEPPTVDWLKISDVVSGTVIDNIMEGLLELDLDDPEFKPVPALALSVKPLENARVWVFKLRRGVKWTDGVEFTGQHVVDGWERLLDPATASPAAYFLFPIKNAGAYNAGKIKDFNEVGVKLVAPDELRVELEEPMGYFPLLVTHGSTFPVRKDLIAKFGDQWTEPANLVTLGPYKLKSWNHDENLTLERFDGYWGEKAKIKYVLFYLINEFSTALNLVESGRIDFQMDLPAKELPFLRKKRGYREVSSFGNYYFGFNVTKKPFDDVRVRRAFSHAVDRQQIVELLGAGNTPLSGWVPLGMMGYDPHVGLKFNPTKAKKLLDEAGFRDRRKFPRVTIAFNTNENHQRIAENMQAQLKKNLDVDVELSNEDFKSYLSKLNADPPHLWRLGWVADFPDPATFTSLMTSYSENNHSRWKSKAYDDLHAEASRMLDREKRREAYVRIQKFLNEDEVPVMPIYSWVDHYMVSERVRNLPLTPARSYIFKGAFFK